MSPAERSRRYRARKRDGVHFITVEVDGKLIDGLVSYGFVDKAGSKDREQIEDGLAVLMYAVAEGGIGFLKEWLAKFE